MSSRKRTTGFTLIELLVVIAIIAILAAILFPVFAKAREKAMATTCLNNIKQQALAVHMYLGDWDGFYPIVLSDRNWVLKEPSGAYYLYQPAPCLRSAMLPYVENNYGLFHCPLDNRVRLDYLNNSVPGVSHALSYKYPCYESSTAAGVFGNVICDTDGVITSVYVRSKNIDDLGAPANIVIIGEIGSYNGYVMDSVEYHDECTNYPCFRYAYELNYHGDVGNYAFADGHAKAISNALPSTDWGAGSPYCRGIANMYTWRLAGP